MIIIAYWDLKETLTVKKLDVLIGNWLGSGM